MGEDGKNNAVSANDISSTATTKDNVETETTITTNTTTISDIDDAPLPNKEKEELQTETEPTTEEVTQEQQEQELQQELIENLYILPPKVLNVDDTEYDEESLKLKLPPLRMDEPISSIKAVLSEVIGYAHISNYRLVLEKSKDKKETKKNGSSKKDKDKELVNDLVYSYTSKGIILPPPIITSDNDENEFEEDIVLDDYSDLSSYVTYINGHNYKCIRVVLESYNLSSVKDHIIRIRSLVNDGNCPHLKCLIMSDEDENEVIEEEVTEETKEAAVVSSSENEEQSKSQKKKKKKKSKKKNIVIGDNQSNGNKENQKEEEQDISKKAAQLLKELSDKLPNYSSEVSLTNNYDNLEYFYNYSCNTNGQEENSELLNDYMKTMKEYDDKTQLNLIISYNKNNHPPTRTRNICYNDIAYIDLRFGSNVYYITAIPSGFYINRSTNVKFDPRPRLGNECYYSHSLLDCILLVCIDFQIAWSEAITASKERALLNNKTSTEDTPLYALYRIIKRAFNNNNTDNDLSSSLSLLDSVILKPCWLLPNINDKNKMITNNSSSSVEEDIYYMTTTNNNNQLSIQQHLSLLELNTRCWNEEFQSGREMPITTLQERIDRARVLHKVQIDFTDAALQGVKYIVDGFVVPMNPSECYKSHVYLFNNIFFSRAVDAAQQGTTSNEDTINAPVMETFKIARGDKAARKSASRDVNCINILHKLDVQDVYTLLTVLVDYLGTRYVCQSVVPGILHGEKTHELLCGAVEANSPLIKNDTFHDLLLNIVGKHCRVATRNVPIYPIDDDNTDDNDVKNDDDKDNKTIEICVPMEAKGIQGSDKRKYILDLTRVTPRDANWVSKENDGTGNWENEISIVDAKKRTATNKIPNDLNDDEWTMAVLRPELIALLTQNNMGKYIQQCSTEKKTVEQKNEGEKQERSSSNEEKSKENSEESSSPRSVTDEATNKEEESSKCKNNNLEVDSITSSNNKEEEESKIVTNNDNKLDESELQSYLTSLQYNVNVFLPKTNKSLQKYLNATDYTQYKKDEEHVKDASNYLWNVILPTLTSQIRENSLSIQGSGNNGYNNSNTLNSLPVDGHSLKELLHSRGINLRYLGRLAQLANIEEQEDMVINHTASKDDTTDNTTNEKIIIKRKSMPQCWLELLEVEMIARATKHIIDKYLIEMEEGSYSNNNNSSSEIYPAQIISSVLSAMVSKKEESAADTEKRLSKQNSNIDEDDEESIETFYTPNYYPNLNQSNTTISRDRSNIWNDIEDEIGRRYRYTLHLFNRDNKSNNNRVLYLPLLRRVCQKCGIRLASKNYNVGGKSICSTASISSYGSICSNSTTTTYPIAPKDVLDILPLIKHSGASSPSNTGFTPCSFTSSPASSCIATTLHIMLPDAASTQQAAHLHYKSKSLSKALDAAQDAASLYQRVIDTALHVNIAHCLDLSAIILFAAQELDLAAGNAARSLALYVQLFGPDCMEVVTCHTTLAHILLTSSSNATSTSSSGDTISFGIQHLRNALYLMQIMGGPNYIDISSLYHKLGTMYHEVGSGEQALRFYQEALTQHGVIYDKMLESMITKSIAMCCSALGEYKSAFEYEKRAYTIYSSMFGDKHELTVNSNNSLQQFMRLAVDQGAKLLAEQKASKLKEEEDNAIITTTTANTTKAEATNNDKITDENKNIQKSSVLEEDSNTNNISNKKKKPKKKKNKKRS